MTATAALTPQTSLANVIAVQDSEPLLHPTRLSAPTPNDACGQTSATRQVASTASCFPQKDTSVPTLQRPPLAPPPTAQALADKINHILASLVATAGDVCKGVLGVVGFLFAVFRTPMYVDGIA